MEGLEKVSKGTREVVGRVMGVMEGIEKRVGEGEEE